MWVKETVACVWPAELLFKWKHFHEVSNRYDAHPFSVHEVLRSAAGLQNSVKLWHNLFAGVPL